MIIGAAFIALIASQAAPTAEPSLTEAFGRAAQFCEAATTSPARNVPAGVEIFMPDPEVQRTRPSVMDSLRKGNPRMAEALAAMEEGQRPFSALPPLVNNFMNTLPNRHVAGVSFVARFPTATGAVWAFPARQYSACDIMVTGGSDVPGLAKSFAEAAERQGWTLVREVDASARMPLSQRLLLKRSPAEASSANGTRLKMQWLSSEAGSPDGVQLELNYLSGDIAQPAPTTKK